MEFHVLLFGGWVFCFVLCYYFVCFGFLDEYWQNHPELHDIPIYYASSLAKKCMAVYQTYVNAMNDKIRKQININNPFVFKHISNLKVSLNFLQKGECDRRVHVCWIVCMFNILISQNILSQKGPTRIMEFSSEVNGPSRDWTHHLGVFLAPCSNQLSQSISLIS